MTTIFFSKYHNLGNDFIIIDDRKETFPIDMVKKMCDRNLGIGADGVILLRHSKKADYQMLIFNKDGSRAQSCGNGLLCFMRFLKDRKIADTASIETLAYIARGTSLKKTSILIPPPKLICKDLKIFDTPLIYINSGVPHVVTFSKTFCIKLAKKIRNHEYFSEGTNVNFVTKDLKVRTYERGVEGETLACGTGAVAVAYAAYLQLNKQSPVFISFKTGILQIEFVFKDNMLINAKLTNKPEFVYYGNFILK